NNKCNSALSVNEHGGHVLCRIVLLLQKNTFKLVMRQVLAVTAASVPSSVRLCIPNIMSVCCRPIRPEPHGRGGASQHGQADSPLPEQDEEILGSDDDEQEDPNDYCRGRSSLVLQISYLWPICLFWIKLLDW
ncbi:hypothetical protein XENOCAPTIV_001637, partial [Xenoophorus captivus]